MKIAKFASKVGLSETAAIDEKARAMKKEGREVFNFGVGQPDFPTPREVCDAGIQAIRDQKTRYTSMIGTVELRQVVSEKLKKENGLEYGTGEILISSGAKHSIHNLLSAALSPDEEVLVPTPAWVSYPNMIRLLGGVPTFVPTSVEDGFKLTPEKLRAAITPRTTGLLLNSPCNPTGAMYSEAELAALVPVILDAGLWVISDEVYERIVFDGRRHVSIAALDSRLRDRVAVVNGVSKSFSMTGWRIGYAAGPKDWIVAAGAVQSHQAGNPCSISQEAAQFAIARSGANAGAMCEAFERRRDLVMRVLDGTPGCDLFAPQGTFYLFPRIRSVLKKNGAGIKSDPELVSWLLEQTGVATVPGEAFISPGHLRISFAVEDATLEKGLKLMRGALERIAG
jgi:aspartate aminotransferase